MFQKIDIRLMWKKMGNQTGRKLKTYINKPDPDFDAEGSYRIFDLFLDIKRMKQPISIVPRLNELSEPFHTEFKGDISFRLNVTSRNIILTPQFLDDLSKHSVELERMRDNVTSSSVVLRGDGLNLCGKIFSVKMEIYRNLTKYVDIMPYFVDITLFSNVKKNVALVHMGIRGV